MDVSIIPKDNPSYRDDEADLNASFPINKELDVFDVLLAGVESDD